MMSLPKLTEEQKKAMREMNDGFDAKKVEELARIPGSPFISMRQFNAMVAYYNRWKR